MAKAPLEQDDDGRQVRRPIVNFNPKIVMHRERDEPQDDDDDVDNDELRRQAKPLKKAAKTEFEEVEIGGKKYKMEKGAAEALKAKPKKPPASDTQQIRQMLEEYTAKIAPKPKKQVDDDDDDEDDRFSDTRLFTDTKGFVKDFKATLSKEILAAVGGAYNQDQSQKAFWSGFYSLNGDLADYDFIVKAVLEKNKKELAPMDVDEASERLAELAREQLMTIAKKVSKGGGKKNKFHVEGESTSRNEQRGGEDEDEEVDDDERDRKAGVPMTMSAVLRMRKEKRQRPLIRNQDED